MKQLIRNFQLSWKTSVLGICLIIGGGVFCLKGQWEIGGGFITAGLKGLISKDYDDDDAKDAIESLKKEVEKLQEKNAQLIDIVNIMQDLNAHNRAERYTDLNQKLNQLKENEEVSN